MNAINKALRGSFALSMILTVMLAAGIPLIPVGFAVVGGGFGTALGVIGIAFAAVGFYGCPIAWVAYGGKKSLQRVVSAVVEEHIYEVSEIAAQLGLSEKEVRNRIDTCFKKKYFIGYKREGDRLVLNENKALEDAEHVAECPHCGARFTYKGTDIRCPYCGSAQERK